MGEGSKNPPHSPFDKGDEIPQNENTPAGGGKTPLIHLYEGGKGQLRMEIYCLHECPPLRKVRERRILS
jgi:hypothetical protein